MNEALRTTDLLVGAGGGGDLTSPLTHDQAVTFGVILYAATGLIAYDAIIAATKGTAATESWTVAKLSAN